MKPSGKQVGRGHDFSTPRRSRGGRNSSPAGVYRLDARRPSGESRTDSINIGATTKAFDKALRTSRRDGRYLLRLYVAGTSVNSRRAVLRARRLCETELKGQCELEVIDVYQQPILARDGQIIATPTLVKEFPRPVRRLIGDMKDARRLIVGLDVSTRVHVKADKTPA